MKAKYYIYKNIRNGKFSVKYKGKVIDRLDSFIVDNAEFKVSEKSRQKVIKEKTKNVHAYVIANTKPIKMTNFNNDYKLNDEISYNPYVLPYFYHKISGKMAQKCEKILGLDGKIYKI